MKAKKIVFNGLIVLVSIILLAAAFLYHVKHTDYFAETMSQITDRELRDEDIINRMEYGDITAAYFTVSRSDEKVYDDHQMLMNTQGVYHLGYIEKNRWLVKKSDFLEIGPWPEYNKFYILPIEDRGISYVLILLNADGVNEVSYEEEDLEYIEHRNEGFNTFVSFFVPTENVNTSKIDIKTFGEPEFKIQESE